MQPFAQRLNLNGAGLNRRAIDALQVNLGRYCNLACIHCHVESGPTRTEMMSRETVNAVLHVYKENLERQGGTIKVTKKGLAKRSARKKA